MDRELSEHVMIEQVEMIARLTAEGACQERDREIALNLIAEIAQGSLIKNNSISVVFTAMPDDERLKTGGGARFDVTLDKDQKIGQPIVDDLLCKLIRHIQSVFPSTRINIEKGFINGVERAGLDKDSECEASDSLHQRVLKAESWR